MRFEWDSKKNHVNQDKHGISFETASLIFLDEARVIRPDTRFEYAEARWITLGSISNRIHVVVYCERGAHVMRIISARKANKRERTYYELHKISP